MQTVLLKTVTYVGKFLSALFLFYIGIWVIMTAVYISFGPIQTMNNSAIFFETHRYLTYPYMTAVSILGGALCVLSIYLEKRWNL